MTMTMTMRLLPIMLLHAAILWPSSYGRTLRNPQDVVVEANYLIGTGIYDMTGPAAEINLMGYAKPKQNAHGIHQRLRARAFIMSERPSMDANALNDMTESSSASQERRKEQDVEQDERDRSLLRWGWNYRSKSESPSQKKTPLETLNADPDRTVCFVSIDAGMGSDLLNARVLSRLEKLLPLQGSSVKRLCHLENLSISGTHTHSGPGGFLQYVLYQMTSYGFFEETMSAFVEGIAMSILRAYDNLQPGSISTASGTLHESNINRSPTSYLLNPKSERDQYVDHGDTDKMMLLLKYRTEKGTDVGMLNWFSVHGTSMNSSNTLLSGDNKGYASYLTEKRFNGNNTLPGKGSFVAAFASTNLGDVSPNTKGPRCVDTGMPCDVTKSTCNGRNELCVAPGPGKDMFESTEIIGRNQFKKAMELYQSAKDMLTGDVDFRHSFVDMSNLNVTLETGDVVRTCPAALGYSFAAGTTDGPGTFDFAQGSNSSNPFWNAIGGFLSRPSPEQIACQAPKPILLNTGEAKLPYLWDPASVPISVFRVGQLFILNVPGEFTTMAGRRLRRALKDILVNEAGIKDPLITIAGLSNTYTHYIATLEEYAGQRYEAASTLYGPHTLEGYIQEFRRLTHDLVNNKPSKSGPAPGDQSAKQMSLVPPVEVDTIRIGKKFGSVIVDADEEYATGARVRVTFHSANPRNNQRIEDTFLKVDMLDEHGSWQTKYVDGDWCTRFHWIPGPLNTGLIGESVADIIWDIPSEAPQGMYRICHFGTRKTLFRAAMLAYFNAPDWFMSSTLGSFALHLVENFLKVAVSYSSFAKRQWDRVSGHRYKDFSGCSRTFLLKSQ